MERLQGRLTHFVIYPEKIYNRHQLTVELIASKNSKSLSACLSCNVPECLLWLDCSLRSRFKVFLHPLEGMSIFYVQSLVSPSDQALTRHVRVWNRKMAPAEMLSLRFHSRILLTNGWCSSGYSLYCPPVWSPLKILGCGCFGNPAFLIITHGNGILWLHLKSLPSLPIEEVTEAMVFFVSAEHRAANNEFTCHRYKSQNLSDMLLFFSNVHKPF